MSVGQNFTIWATSVEDGSPRWRNALPCARQQRSESRVFSAPRGNLPRAERQSCRELYANLPSKSGMDLGESRPELACQHLAVDLVCWKLLIHTYILHTVYLTLRASRFSTQISGSSERACHKTVPPVSARPPFRCHN